jgi:DNA-binding NarL/FixJ family response regulator
MLDFLLVDDHALFRSGLRHIIEDAFKDARVEEAGGAAEALERVARGVWSLVLLDISMPGRSGLDILRDLKALHSGMPVLVLSMHSEIDFVARALQEGAAGYITKDKAPEQLLAAVRKILDGGRYVDPAIAESLAVELSRGDAGPPHHGLSPREVEVFRGLVKGVSLTGIAESMNLSVKTVSTYRSRLLEKLRVGSNAEMVRYAARHGLFEHD